MTHTQGPWKTSPRRDGGFEVNGPPDSAGDASRSRYIARVMDAGALVGEAAANARLIAAAPETTAEGQALIDELDRTDLMPLRPQDRERIEVQVRRLRAAIQKATEEVQT